MYSRAEEHACKLAEKIGCRYTANIDEITEKADVYIISVKDDAISNIAEKVGKKAKKGCWCIRQVASIWMC